MSAASASPSFDRESGAGVRSTRYERQRVRIVDAATALVNEKGVSGMTLQEVAQTLDLTTTSITYYYRYKEQLAAAVFEDTLSRLNAMAVEAARAPTPRARVGRYVEIFFDQFASTLRGVDRPLAVLSEIRTLDPETRRPLIARYQDVFRTVRGFFGDTSAPDAKRLNSARAQALNEALFWSALWLGRYPLRDFHNICRRMSDILINGLAAPGASPTMEIVDPEAGIPDDPKREFLRVAACLINDIGYKGASVERIVGELKITKGSFYHHLEAKDDLILACYRDDYQRLARLQDRVDAFCPRVVDKVASGIASAVALQFDGAHPLLRTTALQAMPAAVRRGAIERFDRLALRLSGLLVDGMSDGSIRTADPIIAANILISTVNSAYDMRSWAREQPLKESIALYAAILMTGLCA